MHQCVVRLLKAQDEESLDCVCKLLPRSGKDLDPEEAKVTGTEGGGVTEVKIALFIKMLGFSPLQPQVEQCSDHTNHLIPERKTSPRTCLLSQDVLDLREVNI